MGKYENLKIFIQDSEPQNYVEIIETFRELTQNYTMEDWDKVWNILLQIKDDYLKLVMLWECIFFAATQQRLESYMLLLKNTRSISWSQKYFIQWQIVRKMFGDTGIGSKKIQELLYSNYHQMLCDFTNEFENLHYIRERNENLIFVTVQQFLSLEHGPTKTTLDRARVIQKRLQKKVVIINTAEQMGGEIVAFNHGFVAGYMEELLSIDSIEYEGETFPYVQFDSGMPRKADSQVFIEFVKKHKPQYIVNIGGSSLLIDTCSNIVPVININTVPSSIARTESTIQVTGKNILTKEDESLLKILRKTKDDVIIGRFTSSLKQQKKHFTKKQLNIPEDKFVIAVIGERLSEELNRDFIIMIDEILIKEEACLVIIGKMDTYDQVCNQNDIFKNNSIYLGLQDDVLAILDCCDLYVNPFRTGGGTSVIEAMSKGIPPVTLNYGDVALGAGENFCVHDYNDMIKQIRRYINESEFYQKMSMEAKKRALYMLDSDTAFMDILNKFEEKIKELDA